MLSNTVDQLPEMAYIKQSLFRSPITDLSTTIDLAFERGIGEEKIRPGQKIAVAVGSRGIRRIDEIVEKSILFFKGKGAQPFIIPAMGSHGGSTPEGQKAVLAALGITEKTMKAPVISDMEVTRLGENPTGLNIWISKTALAADHIFVINRVKPHTKFKADIESGLCKMLCIGLGKSKGAAEFHRYAVQNGFEIIEASAGFIIRKANILGGLAVLEDGYGDLSRLEVLPPPDFIDREKQLLKKAYEMMGSIPFDPIDILMIDFFGKDISGIGMDSKVTGRHRDITGDFSFAPRVKRIFVKALSPGSDGNGNGIGLADFTTQSLVEGLDMEKTYKNALTAISPEKAAIPIYFDTDREAVRACTHTIGIDDTRHARIVRILNTGQLEFMQISTALGKEAAADGNIDFVGPWEPFQFDQAGNLAPFKYGYDGVGR
jgi:hypothetical protein